MSDYIYDTEIMQNVFLLTMEHSALPMIESYEISPWVNDSAAIVARMSQLRGNGDRLVGFNNLSWDYPLLHLLLRAGHLTAEPLYAKAQQIIEAQDTDYRWSHDVKPSDRLVEQVDLFKIHHFDNVARATSLKVIEFNLRAEKVMDLPFPPGSILTREQIEVLKDYNRYDVAQTKRFYHKTLPMIRFREELTRKYQRDFLNHNDGKIGKDYFIMMLEASGVPCYDYSPETGRTPRQTRRRELRLADAILPWISFQRPEFQRVLDFLRAQTITETKGVFKDLTATVDGFTFVFGTGGIHGSVENEHIESDAEHVIVDLDVSSYYPNLAIQNRLYPAHLGEKFCEIYAGLYEQRKSYAKESPEGKMLKLSLNSVFGDSNSPFSVFFDPLFTMAITLSGQLLICMLVEKMLDWGIQIIQCNTDGVTVRFDGTQKNAFDAIARWWQKQTNLTLEQVEYRRMWIRDVNSYVAERTDGTVKRKGAYEYDREHHQDHSALVVPKVAEQVLLHGASIRETLENWPDPWDFLLRIRVPKTGMLAIEVNGQSYSLPNTTRYYVAKGGGQLFKHLPPLKNMPAWRRFAVEAGWGVEVCNDLSESRDRLPIDMDWYVRETEKLVLGVM